MTQFRQRAAQGELFAEAIHDLLLRSPSAMIRNVTRAGIERTDLAEIIEHIRRSNNPMERRLRFNPDGTVFNANRLAHWEAKASLFIEKAPYEFYCEYEQRGEPVLLFIAPGLLKTAARWTPVYCGRIRDLVLRDGRDYEAQFPNPRPTIDGWCVPRADRFGIRQSRSGPTGSGTPFRPIDIVRSSMVQISRAKLERDRDGIERCIIQLALFVGEAMADLFRRQEAAE